MPLTPQQLEMLSDAIGNLFDFDALRFLLFKCSGDNLIDEIASRLEPAKKIAFECLRQVERDGTTIAFLAFAIDMRKQSQPFRDLVHQTVPAVAEARPTTKEAVNAIVAALFQTQALLVDPAIRPAIQGSTNTLKLIVTNVVALEAHKGLHDELHKLQLRGFEALYQAAGFVAQGDQSKIDLLRDFETLLLTIDSDLGALVNKLAKDEINREVQEQWIGKLKRSALMLQSALDNHDEGRSKIALGMAQRVLESEPAQLNNVIFATARTLPLLSLADTLNDIGALEGAPPEIAVATKQVRAVHRVLTAKVAEHSHWQEADDHLWTLGRALALPPLDFLKDFAKLWPLVRSQYRVFYGGEVGIEWAQRAQDYATRIDDQLLILDGKLSQNGTLVADDNAPLREMFSNFRRQVRLRFFHIDKELRTECTTLLDIGKPIEQILANLVAP